MDYLNYDKKVQQKPQPQGFGQDVELTKEDFSFGNLNSTQKVEPSPPSQQSELIELFPTPLVINEYPHDYSKELEWILAHECQKENRQFDERVSGKSVYHNKQSLDTFILDKPELVNIRKWIELKLKEFVNTIMGSDNELVITQSWLNKASKGESHHDHIHPNSIISGVWYPQINENLPPISFRDRFQNCTSLSIKDYNVFNSSTFMLPLKMGELILFPSSLSHSVPANQSDMVRVSLSFNTWAKGNLGDISSLTYLPLDRCV